MGLERNLKFSELVTNLLSSEEQARELWTPTGQEFDRAGPDAAKEYIGAEQQRLEERVKNLLAQVDKD